MGLEIIGSNEPGSRGRDDIQSLILYDKYLISGGDDGFIRVWTPDLTLVSKFEAHEKYPIYHITSDESNNKIFTCSSDSKINEWSSKDGVGWNKIRSYEGHKTTIRKLCYESGILYSGDEAGQVKIWKDNNLLGTNELIEEVWDMFIIGQLLVTGRDKDISITEITQEGKNRSWLKGSLPGRTPLHCISKEKFCFLDKSGTTIEIHENTQGFPCLGKLTGHSMIVNAICSDNKNVLYTGGWDKRVIEWDLSTFTKVSELTLDTCITALTLGPNGILYVAQEDGLILALAKESFLKIV